ncbi:MAG: IPT/TIG domain-containing protein [Clostridia bacterium]|nr:IPT/TIG domain-containing protein [Clostridia bacterium]
MGNFCNQCGSPIKDGKACKNCNPEKKHVNMKIPVIIILIAMIIIASVLIIPGLLNHYDGDMEAVISEVSQSTGTIGTVLSIKGTGFGEYSPAKGVMIKGSELTVISWSESEIVAVVSDEKQNGPFVIHDGDKQFKSDFKFDILEIKLDKLVSQKIKKIDEPNLIESKDDSISVIIPGNTLPENDELIISSIENIPPSYDEDFTVLKAYDVSLKSDTHLLNDYVTISFSLEDGEEVSDYSIATWNQEKLIWELLHENMIVRGDGFITGATDHFSLKAIVKVTKGSYRSTYESKYFSIDIPNKALGIIGSSDYSAEEFADMLGGELDRVFEIYCSDALKANGWETFYANNNRKAIEIMKTVAVNLVNRKQKGFVKLPDYEKALEDAKQIYNRPYPKNIDEAAERISIPVVVGVSAIGQFLNAAQVTLTNMNYVNMDFAEGETVQDITSFLADAYIKFPLTFDDKEDFNIMAAHELFHAFQIENLSMYGIGWFAMISEQSQKNMWVLEATAEYAAYHIANQIDVKTMYNKTFADKSYDIYTRKGDAQEYGMSVFLDYMIKHSNATFKSMFETIVDADGAINYALTEYLTSITGKTMPDLYGEFWDYLVLGGDGNLSEKVIGFIPAHYNKIVKLLSGNVADKALEVNYLMSENALNYFAVQPAIPMEKESVIYYLRTTGKKNEFIDMDVAMLAGGYDEKTLSHRNNSLYTMTSEVIDGEQALPSLLTFDKSNKAAMIKVSNSNQTADTQQKGTFVLEEIKTSLKPDTVKIVPGKSIKYTAKFYKVFDFAKKLEVEWDFGDGKTETEQLDFKKTVSVSTRHEYDKEYLGFAAVRLYDVTDGGRTLIANQRVMLGLPDVLTITADQDELTTNKDIIFSVAYDKKYYYAWTMGNNKNYSDDGITSIRTKYDIEDEYDITVTCYRDSEMTEIIAYGELSIKVKQGLEQVDITPGGELYVYPDEEFELTAFCEKLEGFPKGYDLKWTSDTDVMEVNSEDGDKVILSSSEKGIYYADITVKDSKGNLVAEGSKEITVIEEEKPANRVLKWVLVGVETEQVDHTYDSGSGKFYQSIGNISQGEYSGTVGKWYDGGENGWSYKGEIKYSGTFTDLKQEYKQNEELEVNIKMQLDSKIKEGDGVCTATFSSSSGSDSYLEYKGQTYKNMGFSTHYVSVSNQEDVGYVSEYTDPARFPDQYYAMRICVSFIVGDSSHYGGRIRYFYELK